jgi:hypothetical protein
MTLGGMPGHETHFHFMVRIDRDSPCGGVKAWQSSFSE